MYDAVIVSDLHLGSPYCLRDRLVKLFREGLPEAKALYILGDLFDSVEGPFEHADWAVMDEIRRSKFPSKMWVLGNHDGAPLWNRASLLGIPCVTSQGTFCVSGWKYFYLTHGHEWDHFLKRHERAAEYLNRWYQLAYCLHPRFGRWFKTQWMTWTDCTSEAAVQAKELRLAGKCEAVVCGHTHSSSLLSEADDTPYYCNLGCWTDPKETCFATIEKGELRLHYYE